METPEKTNEQTKKKCFVIMPISDVDGYPKGHFNRVYDYITKVSQVNKYQLACL